METPTTLPRWRTITFYTVATLVLLMIVGLLWPLLIFVVLAWLPLEVWQAVFPNEAIDASFLSHRIHLLALGLIFWGLTIGVGLQLWKPKKREAPMVHALAVIVVFIVIDLISGPFDTEGIPIMAGVILSMMLHPAGKSLYQYAKADRAMSGLAILAAVPGAFFVLDHIRLQRLNIPGDQHAEFAHWSTMAVFVTVIILWGLIGSTSKTGWKITAWLSGLSAAAYGVASLVFPNAASASDTGWALFAIGWGVGYIALTIKRTRRETRLDNTAQVATRSTHTAA